VAEWAFAKNVAALPVAHFATPIAAKQPQSKMKQFEFAATSLLGRFQ